MPTKTIWAILVIVTALTGCAVRTKKKAPLPITYVPGHCVVADEFTQPCPEAVKREGWTCPNVHIKIKPVPECNQYNVQNVLVVPQPK